MNNKLRTLAIAAMALTTLVAQADDATLGHFQIDRGFATSANLDTIRQPDGSSFRITGFQRGYSWAILAGTRIPRLQVRLLRVTIRGKKSAHRAFLSMLNVETNQWNRLFPINLPSDALAFTTIPVFFNAKRFVSNGGNIRVRVESDGFGSAFYDFLKIGVDR